MALGRLGRLPAADWPWWMAPLALVAAVVLANIGALIVDIPALLLGVHISGSKLPGGIELADTFVQDAIFIGTAVLCAQLGGRAVRSWQFGLRPTAPGRAAGLAVLTLLGFLLFSAAWAMALHVSSKEKLLEQLGANESTSLLLLSAALTTVVAPICEEFLFRGFIFRALSNWKGAWPAAIITGLLFGAIHAGSAPAVDLLPLAALGFGLCLLYRYTGSLYPCIAVHALNNSLAFGDLEGWSVGSTALLAVGALTVIFLLARILRRVGVIAPESPSAPAPLTT